MPSDVNLLSDFEDNREIVALWSLRILLDLKGIIGINHFSMNEYELLHTFNLEHLRSGELEKNDFEKALRRKKKWYLRRKPRLEGVLKTNIDRLENILGLSCAEKTILAFVLLLNNHPGLMIVSDTLGNLSSHLLVRKLSVILQLSAQQTWDALSSNSLLVSSGLLRISPGYAAVMYQKFQLGRRIEDILFEPVANDEQLLRHFFTPSDSSSLKLKDFAHLENDIKILSPYLKQVAKNKVPGVNILIYGAPGTGKTEFARSLAQSLDTSLHEIVISDDEGHPLKGEERLFSYQLSQKVLRRSPRSIILFDEIEDIFPQETPLLWEPKNSAPPRKAWINRLLEENNVPSIWISNEINHIDKAFIRRFDFVINLKVPPVEIREKIILKHFQHLPVDHAWINKLAKNPDITPGLISKAEKVVSCLNSNKQTDIEFQVERVIDNTSQAMGNRRLAPMNRQQPLRYDAELINADHLIKPLIKGLVHHPHARICLYGPPGTGKTEFAHHLSEQLKQNLLVKRASDLLDAYLGMSEKNIAHMFTEAIETQSIILLDEADSFLRERSHARHSWEVTLVNELLTQMEVFDGIFICSTNLVNELDLASLRRFDLKIKLDYLNSQQAWKLFRQTLKDNRIIFRNQAGYKAKLKQVTNLTPGDFAAVVRQMRFSGEQLSAHSLFHALQKEIDFKPSHKKNGIGFRASLN